MLFAKALTNTVAIEVNSEFEIFQVAIKTIKKSKIETEADLVRIRREIQIMSSVHHPHIIHIYEGKMDALFASHDTNVSNDEFPLQCLRTRRRWCL